MAAQDKRLVFVSRAVVGGFALAALCQAKLQILDKNQVLKEATEKDRYIVKQEDSAKRGVIYTADGRPLAEDEDTRVLNIDFLKVPHTPAFFMEVSAATGIPASEFQQLADSGLKNRTWRRPLSSAQAADLQQVKSDWRADGISLAPSGRRTYPLAEAAAGFVGAYRDGHPIGGIESGFNKALAGRPGEKVGLVDREGHFLPMRLDSQTVQKVDGQDVTLTIDSQLQVAASDAVRQTVQDNNATEGIAIIMNPHTGDIVAMANWPSYDPNILGQADAPEQKIGFNPNYMAAFEPGSMFKILTLAKAYDCGAVKDGDGVYCHGELAVGKRFVRCDEEHGTRAHGVVSPQLAIAKSCNVSAATWALRIGYDPYVRYLERCGVMSKPKLGIPGETAGLFNYNDPAQQLHLANLGFGQAINVVPVQLASALCMLANNGLRMQPRIVKKIGSRVIPPVALAQLVKPEVAQKVLKIMQLVIQSNVGTGKALRIPGYILAGKTGTAQKANTVTHTMSGGGYVANFIGFVPGDKPQYAIMVMIDNPKEGKYYGAQVAGPVFRELALDVINRFSIPPNAPYDLPPITAAQLQAPISQFIYPPFYDSREARAQDKADRLAAEKSAAMLSPSQDSILGRQSANENLDNPIQLNGQINAGVGAADQTPSQNSPDQDQESTVQSEDQKPILRRHRHRRRSAGAKLAQ